MIWPMPAATAHRLAAAGAFLLAFLVLPTTAHAATLYWVGGDQDSVTGNASAVPAGTVWRV